MEVTTIQSGNATVFAGNGRLDSNSSAAFEDALLKVINEATAVVLDMSGFHYVSSAGLRVLLMAAKKSKAAGNKLVLCGLTPEVKLVFDISGFLALFSIYPTRDDALAAVA